MSSNNVSQKSLALILSWCCSKMNQWYRKFRRYWSNYELWQHFDRGLFSTFWLEAIQPPQNTIPSFWDTLYPCMYLLLNITSWEVLSMMRRPAVVRAEANVAGVKEDFYCYCCLWGRGEKMKWCGGKPF